MLLVNEILVSEDIIEKEFVCNLKACKGICCIEGDAGAPLELEELNILDQELEKIKPFLSQAGLDAIDKQGAYTKDFEGDWVTPLINNEACAYTVFEQNGTASCGIEKAYLNNATTFKKPISCHLYPIRIVEIAKTDGLNYDRWSICSDACTLGANLKVPIYKFLKEPLIRKYGTKWYEELEDVAIMYNSSKNN